MFRHTKTEVDCSPGASTEVVKKEMATDHAPGKQKKQKKKQKNKKQTTNQPPPATAEKSKIKQVRGARPQAPGGHGANLFQSFPATWTWGCLAHFSTV